MFVKYIFYIFIEKGLEEKYNSIHSGEQNSGCVFFLITLVFKLSYSVCAVSLCREFPLSSEVCAVGSRRPRPVPPD